MAPTVAVLLVAALSFGFAMLEMFLWNTPWLGLKVQASLGVPAGCAEHVTLWAKNQGLYNLFLVAGLIWAVICRDPHYRFLLSLFFLGCVGIAGLYGALTVKALFLVAQTLPAAIALSVVIWRRGS